MDKLYLTQKKKKILSNESIIFYPTTQGKYHLIEIFDLNTNNQKNIKIISDKSIMIKSVLLSQNKSYLILRIYHQQPSLQIVRVIQLINHHKFPTQSFVLDTFKDVQFYTNNIWIISTTTSIYLMDLLNIKERQVLIKDQNIIKVIVGDILDVIVAISQKFIYVFWMKQIGEDRRRKSKKIQRKEIEDLFFIKQKIFMITKDAVLLAQISYFDDLKSQIVKKDEIQEKVKSIYWQFLDNRLKIFFLTQRKVYLIDYAKKQFIQRLYDSCGDHAQIIPLKNQSIYLFFPNKNILMKMDFGNQQIKQNEDLNQSKENEKINKRQIVFGGIRLQSKLKQITNIEHNIRFQLTPSFFLDQQKANPVYFGSKYTQFNSIFNLYENDYYQQNTLKVDGVQIPIRQMKEETKHYIPQIQLEQTLQTRKNMKNVMIAIKMHVPILLEGEAGCGKTAVIQYLAKLTNNPLFRINLNSFTGISDILGKLNFNNKQNQIKFLLSNFTKALEKGYWVLLDEANLAKDQVLNVIEHMFSLSKICIVNSSITGNIDQVNGVFNIRVHPGFQLFLAQNPGGDRYSSRNIFSESFLSNMICLKFSPIPSSELKQIICKRLINSQINRIKLFSQNQAEQISKDIINTYDEVKKYQNKQRSINNVTIRNLLQISDIFSLCYYDPSSLAGSQSIKLCFTQTLDEIENKKTIERLIDKKAIFQSLSYKRQYYSKLQRQNIQLIKCDEDILFSFCDLCSLTKRPGLLYSSEPSGKISFFLKWAKIRQKKPQNIIIINLTKDTQIQDLYGKIFINDDKNKQGKYIFKDGPVTKAIKEGKILILRSLDRVDAAVSQSLNGILQADKNRAVCIYDQYIRIHQNTLIFATASVSKLKNAPNLSPALLSRFFSISQPNNLLQQDLKTIFSSNLLCNKDSQKIIRSLKSTLFLKGTNNTEIKKSDVFFYMSIINNFMQSQILLKVFNTSRLNNLVLDHLNFFSKITKDKKIDIKSEDKLSYPFDYKILMREDSLKKITFTMTASRIKVANAMAFCIACKIPIVLQGKAGIGKSKIIDLIQLFSMYESLQRKKKIISINKSTTINDLMGTLKLTKKQAVVEIGPLKSAMIDGMIVLLDEFNLASSSVLSFIEQLLRYPKDIVDPITGSQIKIHSKFRIIASQNPSSYAGRDSLPNSIRNKVILINVPLYSKSEITNICKDKLQEPLQNKALILQKEKIQFLVNLFAYSDQQDPSKCIQSGQFKKKSKNTTLRLYIKLCKRLRKLHLQSQNKQYLHTHHWKQFIKLNATLIFPEETLSQHIIKIKSIDFKQLNKNIRFTVSSQNCIINIDLPLNLKYSYLIPKIKNQSDEFQMTLFNLALCKFFKENVLLIGQTSHKTTVVTEYFSKIIKFELTQEPLTTIYLSNLTQMSEILGTIQPHNDSSYRKYLKTRLQYFIGKIDANQDKIEQIFNQHRLKFHQNQQKNFKKFLQEKDQFFTICERNILPAIRYGGIAFLKNINLPDQSKIEGLNSLFQIDQSFVFNNEELTIHKQFMVIATIHLPTYQELSPAFRSRFCSINIKQIEFLEKLNRIIKNKIFKTEIEERFAVKFIQIIKQMRPDRYKQLNEKHLHNWLKFYKLQLQKNYYQNQGLAKLIIGAEIVFIENLELKPINFQEQIRNKILQAFGKKTLNRNKEEKQRSPPAQLIEVYQKLYCINQQKQIIQKTKDGLFLKYMRIKIKRQVKTQESFIFSKTIIKNIFRLACVSYTNINLNLKGPPGIGKTAICKIASQVMGKQFVRICCSESMQLEDMFGSYIPIMKGNKVQFRFQKGKVLEALNDRDKPPLILFDEINLAPSDVLSGLIKIFNSGETSVRVKDYHLQRANGIFVCAMNPPEFGGGRKDLPDIITNELCPINLDNLSFQQLKKIVTEAYGYKINKFYQKNLQILLGIHAYLQKYNPNIRHFQNIAAILATFSVEKITQTNSRYYCALATILVYSSLSIKTQKDKVKKQIQQEIVKRYGFQSYQLFTKQMLPLQIYIQSGFLYMKRNHQLILKKSRFNGNYTFETNPPLKYTQRTKLMLEKLLLTINSNRILLIEGQRVSGKTSLALEVVRLINQPYLYFCLNYQNEISDFLGGICPTDDALFQISSQGKNYITLIDQLVETLMNLHRLGKISLQKIQANFSLQKIQKYLENCVECKQKNTAFNLLQVISQINQQNALKGVKFKFNQGIIRYAMKEGYILILDNIDLAKPVVIERFNSLGQESGKLYINEVGAAQPDKIHQNFRIICIANQKRGEANQLSQAFNNRVIKIQMQAEFIHQNYENHILAVLNADCQPQQKSKHYAFQYKLASCVKNLYKNVHQKQYLVVEQKKVKGYTINQKNIQLFNKITNIYGIEASFPLFFSHFKDIQKGEQITKIFNLSSQLKLQRPKKGILQQKIFEPTLQSNDNKLQKDSIKTLKDFARFIQKYGKTIFHEQISIETVKLSKKQVDQFDKDLFEVFNITNYNYWSMTLPNLNFLKIFIQELSFQMLSKKLILKGQCSILNLQKTSLIVSNNLNSDHAFINVNVSNIFKLNILHQIDFLKSVVKYPLKNYIPQFLQKILELEFNAELNIVYKKGSADIELLIKFKEKIKIWNFFDIENILCLIGINKKSIQLSFNLSKNGYSFGSHRILANSSQQYLQYKHQFSMEKVFKTLDIPAFLNIIPITNLQLVIDFKEKSGKLKFYSRQTIQSVSSNLFSLRNPNIQITLRQSKFQILVQVDLYFKKSFIIKLTKDIGSLLKKQISNFNFCWQKSDKFDFQKQILPIFNDFNINEQIIKLTRSFLNNLSKIQVNFQKDKESSSFKLDINLKFLLNQQKNLYNFKQIEFQASINTSNSNYKVFLLGVVTLNIPILSGKTIKLDFRVDFQNKNKGLTMIYNFDPPILTLAGIADMIINKNQMKNISLNQFPLQSQPLPLKDQILNNARNICNIQNGNLQLKLNYHIKKQIQPFSFPLILFQDIKILSQISIPSFKYSLKLNGTSILFKQLHIDFELIINNNKWSFIGKQIKNQLSFNKILSYFMKKEMNISALNHTLLDLNKVQYDIKTNIIDLSLGININKGFSWFTIQKGWMQYKGVIGQQTSFVIFLKTKMFEKEYIFSYDYNKSKSLTIFSEIQLKLQKKDFLLGQILPQNNINFTIAKQFMNKIHIGSVQFQFILSRVQKISISGNLKEGRFRFTFGDWQVILLVQNIYLQFIFQTPAKFTYKYKIQAAFSINDYQIGKLCADGMEEGAKNTIIYYLNKIDTKKLFQKLIKKHIALLPQVVEIDMSDSQLFTKGFLCQRLSIILKFEKINIFSDFWLKNGLFLFVYDKKKSKLLQKISGSRFQAQFWYKKMEMFKVTGQIKQQKSIQLLKLAIKSPQKFKLSKFLQCVLQANQYTELHSIQLQLKFEMQYYLFEDKENKSKIKSYKLQLNSNCSLELWNIFTLSSVNITLQKQSWIIELKIILFKQALSLRYQNGEFRLLNKYTIDFNKIVSFIAPKKASVFKFKIVLQQFMCDFNNSLYVLMKSPPEGGEWIMMAGRSGKLIYINKLRFEMDYNKQKGQKKLNLQGSLFVGKQQLAQIIYNLGDVQQKNPLKINLANGQMKFDIKELIKELTMTDMTFLPSEFSAKITDINYRDSQSRWRAWVGWDQIVKIQFRVEISNFSINALPFNNNLKSAKLNLIINKKQSGIKIIEGSQIEAELQIKNFTFNVKLELKDKILIKATSKKSASIKELFNSFLTQKVDLFSYDKQIPCFEMQYILQKNQKSQKYQCSLFSCKINTSIPLINHGNINLKIKSFEIKKIQKNPIQLLAEIQFLGRSFSAKFRNNKITFDNIKKVEKNDQVNIMTFLDQENKSLFNASLSSFEIGFNSKKQFLISLKFFHQEKQSSLQFIYAPHSFIGFLKSTYFPQQYASILNSAFEIKEMQTQGSFIKGKNIQDFDFKLPLSQQQEQILKKYKEQKYVYLLSIKSLIVIDNVITRLLNKQNTKLALIYQRITKEDSQTSSKLQISLGQQKNVFETAQIQSLPSNFQSKCIITKENILFKIEAKSQKCYFILSLQRRVKQIKKIYACQLKLKCQKIFDMINLQAVLTGQLQQDKKEFQLSIEASFKIWIIPLKLEIAAATKFSIAKKKMALKYFAFSIQNLYIYEIIDKLFQVKNEKIISFLKLFPEIKQMKICFAGFSADVQGETLPQSLTKCGFPSKIYKFHRYCQCNFLFLKKNIHFLFEFSINRFQFQLNIDQLSFCDNNIIIEKFDILFKVDL